VSLGLR